jgi:RHS repeat-associated protein
LNGIRKNFETGKNNQVTSDGEFRYTYDDEGNRISKTSLTTGEKTAYNWDHRNRLIGVAIGSGWKKQQVQYRYDYMNRLTHRNDELFVHDGWQVVCSLKNGKIVDRYLWGARQDELLCENDHWMLCDHLGTIRKMINENGKTVSCLDYSAFGELLNVSGTKPKFRYTGKKFDDVTGLQWNINRWYDAKVGRWISEDPIGFRGYDTHLYRYSHNSLVSLKDVSGLVSCPDGLWGFWGVTAGGQVIIGYHSASVTFKCHKGFKVRKKITTCCDNNVIEQEIIDIAFADGYMYTVVLGAGIGGQFRGTFGNAFNAPEHTDLAGWGYPSIGFSIDVIVVGGGASGGFSGGGADGGVGPGAGVSASLMWTYTSVTTGYYNRYIKKLSISQKQIIESEKPCTVKYEGIIPREETTYVWGDYEVL